MLSIVADSQPTELMLAEPFAISFSGALLVGALQEQLVQTDIPSNGNVIFDLEDVTYIESTTLVLLVALILKFEGEGRRLIFNFPSAKPVRDFLRTWRFPDAVAKVSLGKSLRRLTTAKTHSYWGENEVASYGREFVASHPESRNRRFSDEGSAKCWPLQIFDRNTQQFGDDLAISESKYWSGPFMQQVLGGLLHAAPEHVPKDIVFEAMANAVRHPGASQIFTASHLHSKLDGRPAHFSMSWWDDGKGIVETLRKPLVAGATIRSMVPAKGVSFDLRVFDEHDVLLDSKLISENIELSSMTSDAFLLLAAVLPGVTRDPSVEAAVICTDSDTPMIPGRGNQPGMGLHYLMTAAIDLYGGSVSFRTKNLFLNIKALKKRSIGKYKAKVIVYSESQSIPGNMITVRLPIRTL